jgi:predicted RNase H-like HicB family nuclease
MPQALTRILADPRGIARRLTIWEEQMPAQRNFDVRSFDVIVERDEEGFYVASVPALPGCHTQAKSLDTLNLRIREAIQLCLDEDDVPERPLEFVGIQRVTIAA